MKGSMGVNKSETGIDWQRLQELGEQITSLEAGATNDQDPTSDPIELQRLREQYTKAEKPR